MPRTTSTALAGFAGAAGALVAAVWGASLGDAVRAVIIAAGALVAAVWVLAQHLTHQAHVKATAQITAAKVAHTPALSPFAPGVIGAAGVSGVPSDVA